MIEAQVPADIYEASALAAARRFLAKQETRPVEPDTTQVPQPSAPTEDLREPVQNALDRSWAGVRVIVPGVDGWDTVDNSFPGAD